MLYLIAFSLTAFIMIGALGFRYNESNTWSWVDCVYYPLAALGIVLLFHNNTGQREVIEAKQKQESLQKERELALANQPHIATKMDAVLYGKYMQLLEGVQKLADICEDGGRTPTCEAARRMSPSIKPVIDIANSGAELPFERRLLQTCNAAESMLLAIEKSDALLPVTSRELIASYKTLSQQNLNFTAAHEVSTASEKIKAKSLELLKAIQKADPVNTDAGKFIDQMYVAQIDFAAQILTSLTPCLATPVSELKQLNDWTDNQASIEQNIENYKISIEKSSNSMDYNAYLFQLKLWPFVLISALALKFGKAVSSIKKQCIEIRPRLKMLWKQIYFAVKAMINKPR